MYCMRRNCLASLGRIGLIREGSRTAEATALTAISCWLPCCRTLIVSQPRQPSMEPGPTARPSSHPFWMQYKVSKYRSVRTMASKPCAADARGPGGERRGLPNATRRKLRGKRASASHRDLVRRRGGGITILRCPVKNHRPEHGPSVPTSAKARSNQSPLPRNPPIKYTMRQMSNARPNTLPPMAGPPM